MAAAAFETQEFRLDDSEAAQLAEAAEQVSKFYSVSVDPKKAALFNLAIVAGGIYTTRFMAWRLRMRLEAGAGGRVVSMPPAGQQARPQAPPRTEEPRLPSQIWPENGVLKPGDALI